MEGFTLMNFDEKTKEKLIELGIKYLIERAHLADFPIPKPESKKKKKLHWTQTIAGKRKMSRLQKLAWKNKKDV
jgi:hypothetical protein